MVLNFEKEESRFVSDPEPSNIWSTTGTIPELRDGGLQVWRLDLNGSESRGLLTQAYDVLTPEERQRASKMRTGTAPEEFVAGRGLLRRLLGASLNCDPRGVEIVLGAHRKPALRGMRMPHFNVSHSGGMVLIALSRTGPVGVDVEYMDSTVETMDVARAAFHSDDLRLIESAGTAQERLLAFYGCWTRREAVAKADGRGLTLPASGFCTGTPSTVEQVIRIGNNGNNASAYGPVLPYFVRSFYVSAYHLGSIALARSCESPLYFNLSLAQSGQGKPHSVNLHDPSNIMVRSNEPAITFSTKKTHLLGD